MDDTILVACDDANVQVINISVWCTTHDIQHEKEVCFGAVSPNGQVRAITCGALGGLEVHSTTSNSKLNITKYSGTNKYGGSVSITPCGTTVVFGSVDVIQVCQIVDGNTGFTLKKNL